MQLDKSNRVLCGPDGTELVARLTGFSCRFSNNFWAKWITLFIVHSSCCPPMLRICMSFAQFLAISSSLSLCCSLALPLPLTEHSHCTIYTFWLNFNSVTYKVAQSDSSPCALCSVRVFSSSYRVFNTSFANSCPPSADAAFHLANR